MIGLPWWYWIMLGIAVAALVASVVVASWPPVYYLYRVVRVWWFRRWLAWRDKHDGVSRRPLDIESSSDDPANWWQRGEDPPELR